jgi:phenylacetate-CoA ligase
MSLTHNRLRIAKKARREFASFVSSEQTSFSSVDDALKQGEEKALALFHQAAKRVPAYTDFLKLHGVRVSKITSFEAFQSVPPTTKETYIQQYSLAERMWEGALSGAYQVSVSSGTSGQPTLWPQNLTQAIEGARTHETLFQLLGIDNKSTLLINGFALGTWVAGTFTLMCASLVNWKGYQLSVVNTGYNLDEVVSALEHISPQYEQTVICGFAPFLKEILEAVVERNPEVLKNSKVRLLSTGQAITEEWRSYLQELLSPDDGRAVIYNLYGSADAALMGYETPDSVSLRRFLSHSDEHLEILFHKNRLPSLYVFDPTATFFEAPETELWITKYAAAPLVRYNIHDEGGVLLPDKIMNTVRKHNEAISVPSDLPFVYLFGRDKFMVKVYGANVYSEQVQRALSHHELQQFISGRFQMEVISDSDMNCRLIFHLELSARAQQSPLLAQKIQETVVTEVCRFSSEYRYVYNQLGDKVRPHINLYPNGDSIRFPSGKILKNG